MMNVRYSQGSFPGLFGFNFVAVADWRQYESDDTINIRSEVFQGMFSVSDVQPLSKSERAYFEPRFGVDFSQVRLHSDAQAAESARALNAMAYSLEQDVKEGLIKWEFSRSYLIAHGDDVYACILAEKITGVRCWDQRPVPCPGFDCEGW